MANWRGSRKLFTLFLYSSWVVVAVGLFFVFMATPWFRELQNRESALLILRGIGGILGILGAPASLVLLIGMAIFCVREDRSTVGVKVVWFLIFFSTACFGAAAYFFTVYRRQIVTESGHSLGRVPS